MRIAKGALVASLTVLGSTVATAQDTLLRYSFTNSVVDPTTFFANTSATKVTASPKVNNQNTSVVAVGTNVGYASQPFLAVARSDFNESGNRSDVYFQFTLSANTGYQLNLSGLSFNVARGGSSGTRDYDVRSSVDNYAVSLTGENPLVITALRPTWEPGSVDQSAAAFQGLSSITYRIRFFTTGTSVNVDFDDITVSGTVTAVPEPATAGAFLSGAGLLLRRRRRVQG